MGFITKDAIPWRLYRTRFAPAPTGDLHIGHLWTLWFNATHAGPKLLLRVDDTNSDPKTTRRFALNLAWFMKILDVPYCAMIRQSAGTIRHLTDMMKIRHRLRFEGGRAGILLEGNFNFMDSVRARRIDKLYEKGLFVTLMRSDGRPTYHLAN